MSRTKLSSIVITFLVLAAGVSDLFGQPPPPPPPPGGSLPPCWPPPCIPLDQGTEVVILGGIVLAAIFLGRKLVKP